jgi:hypothetical protein
VRASDFGLSSAIGLVRQRTEVINRLRSAALQLDLRNVPRDLGSDVGLAAAEEFLDQVPARDLVTDALSDEVRYEIEDIRRINRRIKEIERLLRPLMRRVAPDLMEVRGALSLPPAWWGTPATCQLPQRGCLRDAARNCARKPLER